MITKSSGTFHKHICGLALAVGLMALSCWAAHGQGMGISAFSNNGQLVATNLQPGTVAGIEWASTASGPWLTNWAGLETVAVDTNGVVQVAVPMFYRVRGLPQTNPPVPPPGMALIPAGEFTMGDTFAEGWSAELPTHAVTVSAFYMDKYEVTKALWDGVYTWATNNGYFFVFGAQGKAANHPVQNVTWYDSVKWCNARSQKEGRTPAYYTDAAMTVVYKSGQVAPYVRWDVGYRLPTEAEWEKAARGGASGRRFPWGDTITHSLANYFSVTTYVYDISPTLAYHPTYADGVDPYTSPVGSFEANAYGLYDMAGNVWEWCWDWHGSYGSGAQTDPRGAALSSARVFRGGSWTELARYCRSAYRNLDGPWGKSYDLGFRSALPLGQ
jgi:formylglycine-generating enzyme required for sulfatase activity